MSEQVKYSSIADIPLDELPCHEDADGVLGLCEFCHVRYLESFPPNEPFLSAGEMCAGCGFRSNGAKHDALNRATEELVQAVLAGATERELENVHKDARWASRRERWKNGEKMFPPTEPRAGVVYRLTHKPKLIIRRIMRGY